MSFDSLTFVVDFPGSLQLGSHRMIYLVFLVQMTNDSRFQIMKRTMRKMIEFGYRVARKWWIYSKHSSVKWPANWVTECFEAFHLPPSSACQKLWGQAYQKKACLLWMWHRFTRLRRPSSWASWGLSLHLIWSWTTVTISMAVIVQWQEPMRSRLPTTTTPPIQEQDQQQYTNWNCPSAPIIKILLKKAQWKRFDAHSVETIWERNWENLACPNQEKGCKL